MSKQITRKYIKRVANTNARTNVRQSSGGGDGGGGASQYWVEENYISKLFFNQLFTVYDEDGNIVEPNDTESVIASIKSMFGFWTDAYLSALGNGEGGGAELTLASLADVAVQGVTDGQALIWNATLQKWVPGQGGGIDITAMWAALAQSGTQQIDASHLGTALTGYATQSWVTQQGYLTSSAISDMATKTWVNSQIGDMATKTWVGQNYLGLHATADAATKLATARTIWGRSFDGTGNVSGAIENATTITASSHVSVGGNLSVSGTSQLTGHVGIGVAPHSTYALRVNGEVYVSTGLYSHGYVTALSDIRKKNVIDDIKLDVNAIALARLIRFTWKDGHDTDEHVGGIAQEWQKILPEAVHESADGTLSMDYGAIGMISAVTLARKVVRMESEVESLKKDIEKLKKQLNVV